jgi:group I intron endonuclease
MIEKPVHVYAATCKENGKTYVGITVNLTERKSQHKQQAVSGSIYRFHKAIIKHGWDAFNWELLETCDNRELANLRETVWVERLNSKIPNGYNMTNGGGGDNRGLGNRGYRHTKETKARISETMKNKPKRTMSEEARRRISEGQKGKVLSEETRKRMSESHKARLVDKNSVQLEQQEIVT